MSKTTKKERMACDECRTVISTTLYEGINRIEGDVHKNTLLYTMVLVGPLRLVEEE